MKDLAPDIYRKRLIIEGIYTVKIDKEFLETFLLELSTKLSMTPMFGPHIMSLAGDYDPKHKGFEGVIVWIESGVQIYSWERNSFFSLDIYSCKPFETTSAIEFVESSFGSSELEYTVISPGE